MSQPLTSPWTEVPNDIQSELDETVLHGSFTDGRPVTAPGGSTRSAGSGSCSRVRTCTSGGQFGPCGPHLLHPGSGWEDDETMLLGLRLRNFKAFDDVEQRAPMSKITLIYGPNSGGKSSIIQAILMLKQSALEAGSAATIWGLVTRGEYVDLGSHLALLHNHDKEKQLAVGLSYGNGASRLSAEMAFEGVTDVDEKGEMYLEDSAILSEVTYQIAKRREVLTEARLENAGGSWWTAHVSAAGVSATHKILDFGMGNSFLPELKLLELETLIEQHQEELSERQRGLVRERARLRRAEREDAIELARKPAAELLQALESRLDLSQMWDLKRIPVSFRETLSSVRYLGPLRTYPERLYRIPGVDSYSSGLRGEFAHHRLYYQPGLVPLVNEWFNRFRIPYELDVRRVGDIAVSGEHVALVLVDRRSKTSGDPARRGVRNQPDSAGDRGRGRFLHRAEWPDAMCRTAGDSPSSQTPGGTGRPDDREQRRPRPEAVDRGDPQRVVDPADTTTHPGRNARSFCRVRTLRGSGSRGGKRKHHNAAATG